MSYKDSTKTPQVRAVDLLARMTLDDKIAQMGGIWVTDLIDESHDFNPSKASTRINNGIGHISRVAAATMLPPEASAKLANEIQRFLVEESSLGIPAIIHEESCAGYMAYGATTFPQAIGLAATWDTDTIQAIGDVIRTQMRAVGAHHTLAPVLDIARDPRWGRIEETFGEDPYLVSRIGTAYIKGVQGDRLADGIVATAKHFVGYGLSEGGMNWAPAHISERDLLETFIFPFIAAIQEANVASIMNAYQELDGIPLGSSQEYMVDLLRETLGFCGVVVSDYFTLDMLVQYHHVARDKSEAARMGLQAGIDVELPAHDVYGEPLHQALSNGQIDIALVDASVLRVLKQKFELGLFESPYVDTTAINVLFNNDEQQALSQKAAEQSLVLLKNDNGLLPLSDDVHKIAVIGPAADSQRLMQGDYHYPSHLEGILYTMNGSNEAPVPIQEFGATDLTDHFIPTITLLSGIQSTAHPYQTVQFAKGCDVTGDDTSGFADAIAIAAQADVVVMAVGGKSGLGTDCTTGESIDRTALGLPGVQQQLIDAVFAVNPNMIVVLFNGRPLSLPEIEAKVPAIVEAWLPAQAGGTAIANVLFGHYNPGGKLPVSVPRNVGQIPVYYNHKPSGGRTHWQGEYIDSPTTPLWPFGHGLSYTSFDYSQLEISPTSATAADTVTVACVVTNTGDRVGNEVVQLYIHDLQASVTRPIKLLKGFKRIQLQPKASQRLEFSLPIAHAAFYDRNMEYVVEPGTLRIYIGSSSADIRLTGDIEIVGETTSVPHVFETAVQVFHISKTSKGTITDV